MYREIAKKLHLAPYACAVLPAVELDGSTTRVYTTVYTTATVTVTLQYLQEAHDDVLHWAADSVDVLPAGPTLNVTPTALRDRTTVRIKVATNATPAIVSIGIGAGASSET